jgi:hypothetical protein
VSDSKNEVEETFKDYNSDPSSKVNQLLNICKIINNKNFKMIPKNELERSYTDITKLLKTNFEKIR